MPRRLFTVAEVNDLIPTLERIFTEIVQLHAALRRSEQKLQQLGVEPSRDVLKDDASTGSPGVRQAKAMFKGYYEALLESVGRVADLGGEVKDLDLGLVDFPGRRGSEDISLCWKMGEKLLSHWHPLDTGFSDRRPIDHLVPRERSPLD